MKFLYRMNSAPAGRYYTERGVKDRVPVIELDRKKEKALYCGTLWCDKKGQPWAVIGERGIASDFPGIEEAYKFLTDYDGHGDGRGWGWGRMSEPTFGIYIPSYKRAKTCTAHRFLQYGTYIVRASEEAEYREALKDVADHIQVWPVEDELICGLTEVNQWLIDNAPEDVIAILDDDIHHFYYRMYDTVSLDDPEVVTAELERIGQLMADLKIGFGATDATIRPWNYDCEFSFKGCAGAVRWVNRPVFKAKCHKELEYNYDLDLVLQELLVNRVILKPKYFCSKGLTDTNEGGASGKKRGDQIASINLMKAKWGKYFSYNVKTNVPHINVKR